MLVVHVDAPRVAERALESGSGLQCVRSVVIRIDDGALVCRTQQTAAKRLVHRLESVHPTVLGQVIEVQTNPGADYGLVRIARRIRDAEARGKGPAVIARDARGERNTEFV